MAAVGFFTPAKVISLLIQVDDIDHTVNESRHKLAPARLVILFYFLLNRDVQSLVPSNGRRVTSPIRSHARALLGLTLTGHAARERRPAALYPRPSRVRRKEDNHITRAVS